MKQVLLIAFALIATSTMASAPAQAGYKDCTNNCKVVFTGKIYRKNTDMGACDFGCQAAHWNGYSKGATMCKQKFGHASLRHACLWGADRY